uniref:Uncharacterized protein n=1 Tax=Graphocephala atropunctata TaxID=36148 RepID=A0A1B6M226_9HEMI
MYFYVYGFLLMVGAVYGYVPEHSTEQSPTIESDVSSSGLPFEDTCLFGKPSVFCVVKCQGQDQTAYCDEELVCKCGPETVRVQEDESPALRFPHNWDLQSLSKSFKDIEDIGSNTTSHIEQHPYNASEPQHKPNSFVFLSIDFGKLFGWNPENDTPADNSVSDTTTTSVPENHTVRQGTGPTSQGARSDWSVQMYAIVLCAILLCLILLLVVSSYYKKRNDKINLESIFKTVTVSSSKS